MILDFFGNWYQGSIDGDGAWRLTSLQFGLKANVFPFSNIGDCIRLIMYQVLDYIGWQLVMIDQTLPPLQIIRISFFQFFLVTLVSTRSAVLSLFIFKYYEKTELEIIVTEYSSSISNNVSNFKAKMLLLVCFL